MSTTFTGGVKEVDTNHQLNINESLFNRGEELLSLFVKLSKVKEPSQIVDQYEFMRWDKEISRWENIGVTKKDVHAAIEMADKRKTNLSWPGSIGRYLTSIVARRERGINQKTDNQKSNDEIIQEVADEIWGK